MSLPEIPISPSREEDTLIAMRSGAYALAAADILGDLEESVSPSILAVAQPNMLFGTAEALWPGLEEIPLQPAEGYKTALFDTYLPSAAEGDPAAISLLYKTATTVGQLTTAVTMTLDNRDSIAEWRTGRPYVQFVGAFNPMHIGHRASITNTLQMAGETSSAVVQTANHAGEGNLLPHYVDRLRSAERTLYTSTTLDPARVTMLDLPVNFGLSKVGTEQIRLIADVVGDAMRWQVGSDKFMTDVANVKAGKALDKAGRRFEDVHLYVSRRETEDADALNAGIDYVRDRFGATVTLVPESDNPLVVGASASKIRSLRNGGWHDAANELEFSDISSMS